MKNKDVITNTSASEKMKIRNTKSRWRKAMSAIACVVVFCTVYSLILPAITLEASAENPYEGYTLYCQQAEHSHTEECVEQTLICDLTENPGHIHGDECYSPLLICQLPLQARHTHREDCYKTESQLTCELAESEGHTHTEECVETQSQLTCELDESEGHRHGEDCKGTEKQLICELTESAGHSHTDSCKTVENQLTCTTVVEDPTHVHTEGYDGCYQMVGTEELICGQDGVEGHTHVDECFERVPWFHNCTLHVHGEEYGCYTAVESITCGMEESAGHSHADDCYADAEIIICGKEEGEGHAHGESCYTDVQVTVCEKTETEGHAHSDACYTDVQVADCGMVETDADHTEHIATCYDYEQTQLTCEEEETEPTPHEHSEECYEETVLCEETEHKHSLDCYIPPEILEDLGGSRENFDPVAYAQRLLDKLPTYDEFENGLLAYENAEDWEGYEAYAWQIIQSTKNAYIMWQDMFEEQQAQLTGVENMLELRRFELPTPYNNTSSTYDFYSINYGWTESAPCEVIVVKGGRTLGNIIEYSALGSYRYWTAIVVDANGIVTEVAGEGTKSTSLKAPSGGFMIVWWNERTPIPTISKGDVVSLTFKSGYSLSSEDSGGVDTSLGTFKVVRGKTDNTYDLPTLESVNTYDNIKINMYDYNGRLVNADYDNDKHAIGFQQPNGTRGTDVSLTESSDYNFGDIITTDMDMGGVSVGKTSSVGAINRLRSGDGNPANKPIFVMKKNLTAAGNPSYVDNGKTYDLGWLFPESNNKVSTDKGVTKLNTDNITGLFRIYDGPEEPYNGNYHMDSRSTFLEFNGPDEANPNTFTIYDAYLTPNFLMYPFGNFMPLNSIETTTTRVADMDSARMYQIAESARLKASSVTGTDKDGNSLRAEYTGMADAIDTMTGYMESEKPNWSGFDMTDKYLSVHGIGADKLTNATDRANLANNLYNIDYDEKKNFLFGMTIEFDFMQPKDGYYDLTGDVSLDDAMVFNFAGDDDVWVYIDGMLFLEISGIHRHVGGTIDFQKGEIRYGRFLDWDGDTTGYTDDNTTFANAITAALIEQNPGISQEEINKYLDNVLLKNSETGEYTTFKNYTNHDFKMYYMERGSGSSVCCINFNMPVIKDNSIGVMKRVQTVDGDTSYLGEPWYEFQIFKADANENKTNQLLVNKGTEFEVFDEKGILVRTDTVGENGVFRIKANEIAEFPVAENAGNYYVRELIPEEIANGIEHVRVEGLEQTTDSISGFPALSGFVGYDSNIKNISDGTTIFTYINTYRRYGYLAVEKTVTDPTDYLKNLDPNYEFEITLDGQPLPAGTTYTVSNLRAGESAKRTVNINARGKSTISIKYGQTATIDSGILPGSIFTVRELNTAGYSVNYRPEYMMDTDETGDYATGIILPVSGSNARGTATVKVTVENAEYDTTFELPVTKLLNSFDGKSHKFSFRLEQVNPDGTPVETACKLIDEIVIDVNTDADGDGVGEGTGNFSCELSYNKMIGAGYTFPSTVWLKITETAGTEAGVAYDDSYYMAQVEISYDGSEMSPEVLSVEHYVNGVATEGTENENDISFTNDMLDTIQVSKSVVGGSEDSEFTFTLAVTNGDAAFTDNLAWSKTPVDEDEAATGTLAAENGLYTFTLRHGQTITIENLPVGAGYTVTETNGDGYYTAYRINNNGATPFTAGAQASGTLTWIVDNAQITDHVEFENRAGSQLPHTGGAGTTLYTSGGVLLMGASLILGYAIRKRKEL